MKIYITGVSGTGKTSISKALIAQGVNAIDLDNLSHWENKHTGEESGWKSGASDEWHDSHVWLCDIPKLKEILASSENSVAIGHASNQDDYIGLFDKVFVLRCKPETVVARIEARTDNDFGKHENERRRILTWQKTFEAEMVAKGAGVIDAEKPVTEIAAEVRSYLD